MFAYFSITLTKSEDEESRVSEGRGSSSLIQCHRRQWAVEMYLGQH